MFHGHRLKLLLLLLFSVQAAAASQIRPDDDGYEFNDSHFHLTNYIQEGTPIREFLQFMGTTVKRSTLFGIPLQQEWSYRISGDNAPTYYLQTDAPLYYYSFTDAFIAQTYLSLTKEQQARLDPMITGFNPADMYAADHIRRVLQMYPGVFSGIGEFTIHKEFVSEKVAGDVPSLRDPALDRLLDFAGEVGLVALIHNDVDIPFAKPEDQPRYLAQMKDVLRRHPATTIVWAHMGVGRVVRPVHRHMATIESILSDPEMAHVMFDISWDEVYADSGKWLFFTGLPGKSGVGGGLIAVSPGKFGIAAISPPLDKAGNSVRAQRSITDISNALHGNPYLYSAAPKTN